MRSLVDGNTCAQDHHLTFTYRAVELCASRNIPVQCRPITLQGNSSAAQQDHCVISVIDFGLDAVRASAPQQEFVIGFGLDAGRASAQQQRQRCCAGAEQLQMHRYSSMCRLPDVLLTAGNEQRSSNITNDICSDVGRVEERMRPANKDPLG